MYIGWLKNLNIEPFFVFPFRSICNICIKHGMRDAVHLMSRVYPVALWYCAPRGFRVFPFRLFFFLAPAMGKIYYISHLVFASCDFRSILKRKHHIVLNLTFSFQPLLSTKVPTVYTLF